jgi:hypothetical protein
MDFFSFVFPLLSSWKTLSMIFSSIYPSSHVPFLYLYPSFLVIRFSEKCLRLENEAKEYQQWKSYINFSLLLLFGKNVYFVKGAHTTCEYEMILLKSFLFLATPNQLVPPHSIKRPKGKKAHKNTKEDIFFVYFLVCVCLKYLFLRNGNGRELGTMVLSIDRGYKCSWRS